MKNIYSPDLKPLIFVFFLYLLFILFLTLGTDSNHNSCTVMKRDIQSICKRREELKLEEFKSCEDAYKNLDIFSECKK